MFQIIQLDATKLRHYLKDIRNAEALFKDSILAIEQRVRESWGSGPHDDLPGLRRFLMWIGYVSTIENQWSDMDPEDLIATVKWAQDAKRYRFEFLKRAFCIQSQQLPRWTRAVFKLGRYGIASRVFVQLASEFPALFNPMTVEPVAAPAPTAFTFASQESPLPCV